MRKPNSFFLRTTYWLLGFFLTALLPLSVCAQTRTITGTVKTDKSLPLSGVSIIVQNTTLGTATDDEGRYRLQNVPNGATLTFSFTGYPDQEFVVSDQTTINVTMTASATDMNEVVVIGYGTAKRKDLTGAVASVQATKLEKEAPRSVQDLLRGNAAGLIIGQSNPANTARGDADILVRGSGTLKAGSAPLIVIDGIIFYGTLADINPNDIQSVDILKDASSTAVYGAKAANGVVLITTKKGTRGKPRITFNTNIGMAEIAGMPRTMNAEEFIKWRQDYRIGGTSDADLLKFPERYTDPRKLTKVDMVDWYNYDLKQENWVTSVTEEEAIRSWLTRLYLTAPEVDNYLANNTTNWQDLVFQKGFQQDYTASVSNRNDGSSYYFSLNYVDREGIVVGNRFTNFRTRLNLESKVTSFLKVGANTNFAVRNEGFLQADWDNSAVLTPYASNRLNDPIKRLQRLPSDIATAPNPFYDNLYRDQPRPAKQ